ncbi:MAG: hypothetical protein AAGB18_05370 [Pseudomonadota bacterium]
MSVTFRDMPEIVDPDHWWTGGPRFRWLMEGEAGVDARPIGILIRRPIKAFKRLLGDQWSQANSPRWRKEEARYVFVPTAASAAEERTLVSAPAPIPLPPALPMVASGLGLLFGLRWWRNRQGT